MNGLKCKICKSSETFEMETESKKWTVCKNCKTWLVMETKKNGVLVSPKLLMELAKWWEMK